MPIKFDLPKESDSIIKVIGIGGGGGNAVGHMYKQGIVGVNFAICNTDEQALEQSPVPSQIQLGPGLTDGRGAGSKPEVGRGATLESLDEIKQAIGSHTKMVFITAGMGGGTGTGGAPVVAKAAKEMGLLTVGIVTSPFSFEGKKRLEQAYKGIEEMKANVDTLIVISNDKLRELHGNLSLSDAFAKADDVLTTAAKGIAEIITVAGYVNVDFEDVNTVMKDSGVAVMGTGVADGDDRALKAVKTAMASPLLSDNDIRGAKHILLNITSGTREVLMDEVSEITNYIQEAAGYTSEVIWGNGVDEELEDKLSVTVIATGFETGKNRQAAVNKRKKQQDKVVLSLDDDDEPSYNTPQRNRGRVVETEEFNYGDYNKYEEEPADEYFQQPKTTKRKERRYEEVMDEDERMRVFMERRKRLRGLSMKLNNNSISQLENEPAYKRRNISLEDMPHSSESNVSKYSLFEDENRKPELKKRNPFLHDNVD